MNRSNDWVHEDGRLLCAGSPFVDESRASWVQRICGAHQYSLTRLNQICGTKPPRGDWDRSVGYVNWSRLLRMAEQPVDACRQAVMSLSTLERGYSPQKYLLYNRGRPYSRWCAKCLADDEIPYLRWEWRLQSVSQCSKHGDVLFDVCPWCGTNLWLDRSLLVFWGTGGSVDLAHCHACGMSITDGEAPELGWAFDDSARQLLAELLANLKGSHSPGKQTQLNLDFDRFEKVVVPKKPRDPIAAGDGRVGGMFWSDLRVGRNILLESYPLRMDSTTFLDHQNSEPRSTSGGAWHRTLRPAERVRVAQALKTFRSEFAMPLRQLAKKSLGSGYPKKVELSDPTVFGSDEVSK